VQRDPAAKGGGIYVFDPDGNLLRLPQLQKSIDHVQFPHIE
jgi:hypothetical protein